MVSHKPVAGNANLARSIAALLDQAAEATP